MPRSCRRMCGAALVGALVLAVLTPATSDRVAHADTNTPTVLFGLNPGTRGSQTQQSVITDLEAEAGRTLNGIRVFDLWNDQFPSSYDTWLRDTGHTLFLSVKAKRVNGSIVLWRDIANAAPGSSLYQEIVGWANDVKGFGAHIYFTFNHEPEAATNDGNGTPAEYISAWRNVVDIFRQEGVTNATYVLITTAYAYRVNDGRRIDLWYPGDAWVDALGTDNYNWSDCRPGQDTPWRTLEYLADPLRIWAQDHPDKELMITEWASHEDPSVPGRKAAWITEAQALFKQPGWERFTVALYFHNSLKPTCPFWVDSSTSSLNAWLAMSNDPYYTRTDVVDSQAPSQPGTPTGVSNAPGSIALTWGASDDDIASTLTYRVYRDGGANPVGTVSSSSQTTVSFTDTGLVPSSTHTYRVSASDGANVSPLSGVSNAITVQSNPVSIFADGFDNGFTNWTSVSGLTVDSSIGAPAPPSARASVSSARASAARALGTTTSTVCMSERFRLTSVGANSVSLLRLRTAADGAIARAYVNGSRRLGMRSDVTGAQLLSSSTIALGAWRTVELCGSTSAGGSLSLYLDGSLVGGPWTQSLGSTPFGRVIVGDTDLKTAVINYDDIVVDTTPG